MVYVMTFSHNGAKTLSRAVDSILNQTYTRFRYYLCDNGSTDGGETKKLVEEYAKKDPRIVPSYNKGNFDWTGNDGFRYLYRDIKDDDYLCFLDDDDEYGPEFLFKALLFAKGENLDIVNVGFVAVNEIDGTTTEVIRPKLIFNSGEYIKYFCLIKRQAGAQAV